MRMNRREEKEMLLRALEERHRRAQECPVAHFTPHPGQQSMYAVLETKPIVVVLPGNRWGKTHALVHEIIASGLGYRPWLVPNFKLGQDGNRWYFPQRSHMPRESWVKRVDGLPIAVPNTILVISGLSLARGIGEIIQKKWNAVWPVSKIPLKPYLGPLGTWQKLVLPNGSQIYFGSASQSNMSWEGFDAHAVFADEPIPRRVFSGVRRGLVDNLGRFLITATPLGDANIAWMAADLVNGKRDDVAVIHGSGLDNPHVDQDALNDYLNDPTLSEAERQARKYGELSVLGRRIVTTFDPAHCIVPTTSIPPGVPILMVVDPHHSRPCCVAWFAVLDNRGDELVLFREWPTEDYEKCRASSLSMQDFAGELRRIEGKESVVWRLCDPAFGRQHARVLGETYRSFIEEMGDYGLLFDDRVDNDVDRGIQQLRDACRPSTVTGRPRLRIMSHCTNSINAMQLWSYQEGPNEKLKVSESFKDFADVIRYAVSYEIPVFSESGGSSYLEDDDD